MVQVSENFQKLAQENGRYVYCKIEVGGVTFLDDRILDFTMDDVTHPDWFTIGTACANRFHFRALYDGTFDTGTQVVPYISFDNEEWCCLGLFYISRRYVRGDIISLTAYDRMYSLDMEYETPLSVPCTASALLEDICTRYDIPLPDSGADFTVETLPESCTVRDMIGFIAGLNRACAKFDRQGQLRLRQCSQLNYIISDANCMDIQRNMAESCMTCFKVQTDSELLVAGEGAEIATIETYNPLMDQTRLDRICEMLDGYCFYGADIFMQGLPYLESGESVLLQDGAMLYRIVISEMELHYDGALTAVIYSRNKSYADALVHEDDLELALEQLKSSLCAEAQTFVNAAQIHISEAPVTLVEFEFNTPKNGFAELSLSASISEDTADAVKFSVYLNGKELPRSIIHNLEANSGRNLVHISHLQNRLTNGKNILRVDALTGNGDCFILPDAMQAGVVVYGAELPAALSADTLYSYKILSDNSVECNGRIYEIATNSAGLITKITDELGGKLEPELPSQTVNAALHNAVLWAVAMTKGFGTTAYTLMPHRYGVQWYYDVNYLDGVDKWKNLVNEEAPLTLIGATQNSDGSVRLGSTEASYGSLELGDSMGDSVTMYVVAKCEAMTNSTWTGIAHLANAYPDGDDANYNELGISAYDDPITGGRRITVATSAYYGEVVPSPYISPYQYNVLAVRTSRASNHYSFFVNGRKVGTSTSKTFLPTLTLGAVSRGGVRYFGENPCNYKMLAVSKAEHSDAEVISNCYWLMSRFGVTG